MAEMSEADKYKNEGNRLMQAGDLDGAIEQYSLGINVDEENHVLYSNRSAAYAKKEMWNEALADGTKCVFLKPDWPKGYLRKGEALKQVGKIKDAQFCFQKGCSLDPKDQQMRQGLNTCNMLLYQQQQEEDERKRQAELEEIRNPKPKPPPEPEKPKPPPKPTSEELRKDLATKSVKELRGYLSEKNIDASDCFEKEDLVNKIIRHGAYTRPEPVKEQPVPPSPKPVPVSEQKPSTPVNEKPKETNIPQIPKNDTKPEKSIPQIPVDEEKPKKTQTEEPGAKGAFDDDINYYELLGISKTATPAEIKKAYYKQAQSCHPDKTDDPRAEEQFKLISEAYGVLMDEEKRKTYDKYGRKRVQEMDGGMDPTMMFRMIFGGGAFDDTFGELSFIEQMSPEFASKWEGKPEDEVYAYMNAKQAERVKVLAAALIAKLAAREKGQDKDYESLVSDLQEKCDAPGGPALLAVIGYVYVSEAKKNAGRFFGIEGAVASVQETHHSVKQTFSFISSAVKVAQVQNDMEKGGDVNQEKAAEAILDTLWKLGKMEIEKVIRAVCTVIFKDKSCSKKKRATALKELGELYKRAAKKANKEKGLEKGTFFEGMAKEAAAEEKAGQQPS